MGTPVGCSWYRIGLGKQEKRFIVRRGGDPSGAATVKAHQEKELMFESKKRALAQPDIQADKSRNPRPFSQARK
jgi:hypothetical protein